VLSAAVGADGAAVMQAESTRLNTIATKDKRYIVFMLNILHFEVSYQLQKTNPL
jgi:hypothetical protein